MTAAVDTLARALRRLPATASPLEAALAGAEAGCRVWLVGDDDEPIPGGGGICHGPWSYATRDPERLTALFAKHPNAAPVFLERTGFGFDRARAWAHGELLPFSLEHVKAGRCGS